MCLAELKTAGHTVHLAILDETGSCLVKTEGDIGSNTLPAYVENP